MKKGIYILPSLFTLGNLACGFASIIFSIEGDFTKAAWLILIAGVFDLFDGRIARMTNTTSQFGVEFDSLADIVASGVAPAIMIYNLALYTRPTWGLIISLMFVVAGALRLARFNSSITTTDQNYFQGLPLPAAAGVLASFVIVYGLFEREVTKKTIPIIMKEMPFLYKMIPLVVILLSYLMVSNIRYSSLKKFKLVRPKTFHNIVLIFIAVFLIWRYPENMMLIIFSAYLLSGLVGLLLRVTKISNIKEKILNKK
jgi:CDP-diacylglycerol---serine O-phosphatidyltransferase